MHLIHLLVVARLADQDFDIPEGRCQAALLIYIYGIRPDPVLCRCPDQFQGQIQSQLVFGEDLRAGIGMRQHHTVNDGRLFNIASGNCLYNSFF